MSRNVLSDMSDEYSQYQHGGNDDLLQELCKLCGEKKWNELPQEVKNKAKELKDMLGKYVCKEHLSSYREQQANLEQLIKQQMEQVQPQLNKARVQLSDMSDVYKSKAPSQETIKNAVSRLQSQANEVYDKSKAPSQDVLKKAVGELQAQANEVYNKSKNVLSDMQSELRQAASQPSSYSVNNLAENALNIAEGLVKGAANLMTQPLAGKSSQDGGDEELDQIDVVPWSEPNKSREPTESEKFLDNIAKIVGDSDRPKQGGGRRKEESRKLYGNRPMKYSLYSDDSYLFRGKENPRKEREGTKYHDEVKDMISQVLGKDKDAPEVKAVRAVLWMETTDYERNDDKNKDNENKSRAMRDNLKNAKDQDKYVKKIMKKDEYKEKLKNIKEGKKSSSRNSSRSSSEKESD